MSTAEILAQLPRLSAADREAIRARLDELEHEAPLTIEEEKVLADRLLEYQQSPNATKPWAELRDVLARRLKQ